MNLLKENFISVSADIFMRADNAEIYNYGSGYLKFSLDGAKNLTDVPDDFPDILKSAVSKILKITPGDISFIDEKTYLENTDEAAEPLADINIANNSFKVSSSGAPRFSQHEIAVDTGKGFLKAAVTKTGIAVMFRPEDLEEYFYLGYYTGSDKDGKPAAPPAEITKISCYCVDDPKAGHYTNIRHHDINNFA